MLSQRSLRLSSFLFILFCVFCSSVVISSILSSSSLILLPQLFCYWFLLVYFSFQLLCCSSLFACFLVLLGPCQTFLIFSWSMPPFYFWDFWIIFTIIIMNYFSGRLHLSSSFIWSVCSCTSLLCSFCSFVCKYSSVVSFLLMNGTVFLSYLFGLRRPALNFASSWMDPVSVPRGGPLGEVTLINVPRVWSSLVSLVVKLGGHTTGTQTPSPAWEPRPCKLWGDMNCMSSYSAILTLPPIREFWPEIYYMFIFQRCS